jgi:16S rRNA (guanine966-N2)-methyltransferase
LLNKGPVLKASSNFSNRANKKSSNKGSSGEIRLIGGQWKGRKLKVHDKEGLRPTTDRLKETLFNWLMMDVRGATVLDCFAGAGSLGFEAASRGADKVICIEKDKQAATQLKNNCHLLTANKQIIVKQGDFFKTLPLISDKLSLVFIDPPFNKNLIEPTLTALVDTKCLEEDALVYIEQETTAEFNLRHSDMNQMFTLIKEKSAGQVLAQLYRFNRTS